MALELVVEGEPTRLDRVVVDLQDVGSRSRARKVIDQGKVTVDGEVVRDGGAMVQPGATVALDWNRVGTGAKKVAARRGLTEAGLSILHEDDRLLFLDKPAGLLTDSATREQARNQDSLRKRAQRYLRARGQKAWVVHRIDRDTTGVVLVAKDKGAAENLRHQFRTQRPVRVYDLVVHGVVRSDGEEWADWMAWDRGMRLQKPVPEEHAQAFYAQCTMSVVQRFDTTTRLQVQLTSGRRNQIRLQAMLRGHPLVGERLYVEDNWRRPATPKLERQALHAALLGVAHPDRGAPIEVKAPWPEDFRKLVRSL